MSEKYKIKFIEKKEVAEGTTAFIFEKPAGFTYQAGQTIDLTLPMMAGANMHTFSLVTEPQEECLEIATRMRGSNYKNTLKDFVGGEEVEIEGPFGNFALHQDTSRPAVFISGGIGITPFMSLIRDVVRNNKPHEIYLFYSNRRPIDITFFDELTDDANSEKINFKFIPTITEIQVPAGKWSGEQAYIDWNMIKKYVGNTEEAIYYLAGPQGMVTDIKKMLVDNGVGEESMVIEEFSGY